MFNTTLTDKENQLFELLTSIPPDFDRAEALLKSSGFSTTELTKVALEYAGECFCDAGDFARQNGICHTEEVFPDLNSTYIVEVIRLLLQHGLDPNEIYDDDNIMNSIKFIDNEYLAADALLLLLEHGGKHDLYIPGKGETLFEDIDFEIWFGTNEQYDRQRFAAWVHSWMVLIGCGARYSKDFIQTFKPFDESENFDLEKLKNHRDYSFAVSHFDGKYAISIIDKKTFWEVARVV